MLKRIGEPRPVLRLTFEDQVLEAREGDTVAAALLANGIFWTRDAAQGDRRGPFCMMGACFECRVEIDGIAGRQACMTLLRDGMVVRRGRPPETAR